MFARLDLYRSVFKYTPSYILLLPTSELIPTTRDSQALNGAVHDTLDSPVQGSSSL
jgi:hypothetical protein